MMNGYGFTNDFPAILTSSVVSFCGGISLFDPRPSSVSIIPAEIMPMIFSLVPFVLTNRITEFSFLLISKPVWYFKLLATLLAYKFCVGLEYFSEIMPFFKRIRRAFSKSDFITLHAPSSLARPSTKTRCIHSIIFYLKFLSTFFTSFVYHGNIIPYFMGSGTTIEAAERTGRNSIGIEKDEGIFQTAVLRLKSLTPSNTACSGRR